MRARDRLGVVGRVAALCGVGGLVGCGLFGGDDSPEEPVPIVPDAPLEGSGEPAAAEVSAVPEAEPNNSTNEAGRLTVGRPLSGSLDGDIDVFALPAGVGVVSVSVEGEGVEVLEVFRPQDAAKYTVPASGGAARVPALTRDASVFLTVRGQGAYLLTVAETDTDAPCGFAREPDDTARPGLELASVPSTAVGCISTPDDVDVFRLPFGAWDDAPGFGFSVEGVEGVALEVRAIDAQGRVLARLAGEAGDALAFPNFAAPEAGDVRLEVRSQVGANETAEYRLSLRRLPPLTGAIELEPNDTPEQATPLHGAGRVNGYVHRSGDADHFALTADAAALVRLRVEPPPGVDLEVRVPTPNGELVIDDGAAGRPETLCSLPIGPEPPLTFTLTAQSFQTTDTLPYLLHVEPLEGTNWEVEPNDDVAALAGEGSGEPEERVPAGSPEVGIWLADAVVPYASGYAFPPGDVDRYEVEVFADPSATATYKSVTLRLEPNAPADYTLELVDVDGAAVGLANNGGVGESEYIALDLPAGTYFARVTLNEGEACTRPYRLLAQPTEIPVAPTFHVPPVPAPSEGSGEAPPDGSGAPTPAAVPRPMPSELSPRDPSRPRATPPPTAPHVEGASPGAPTWEAPVRAPAEQPPTFGGGSGR